MDSTRSIAAARPLIRVCFGALVMALALGFVTPVATPAVDPAAAEGGAVRQTEVCFTVHMPGDLTPYQVAGTVFHTADLAELSTAVLLQHGAAADRTFWDGGWPYVKGAPSTARAWARAGYGVFAIDRLGYGASDYDGSGYALTAYAYVEMSHEIVTQMRAGTYRLSSEPCVDGGGVPVGRGVDRVVMAGLSNGAEIVELYATRHHDIDGIVAMAWSNQGVSDGFFEHYSSDVVPQMLTSDYVDPFRGYENCVRWLFHLAGARHPVVEQVCDPDLNGENDGTKPLAASGEMSSAAIVQQDMKASIGSVGPTPALLVFGEHDTIFPGEHGSRDLTTPEIEMWETRCNCPVSVYVQPDAGHALTYHDSTTEMFDVVIDWLDGLGG
ncbi:MAG: alpha/beta hydrolase [Actinobacteria bacterium]|nr:alpha/beta hydrolase [Actinomycetota bacterium]